MFHLFAANSAFAFSDAARLLRDVAGIDARKPHACQTAGPSKALVKTHKL